MIEIKTQGVYEFIKKYGADPRFDHENVLSHEAVIKQAYNKGFMDGWNKSRKWIPCSEMLPEEDNPVFVALAWESVDIGWYKNGEWCSEYCMYDPDYGVIAWMPLPEPYKESED